MTACPLPSALDPLSSSSLNKLHEADQPPSKKRKRGTDNAAGQLATSSIVIRAHAASLSDEPLVLDPIVALPRSHLPLSWLDDAGWSRSDAHAGGLFAADIPTLETDLRTCSEPTVLAVRLTATGGLYVVERVKQGIYSLSRLARWVNESYVVAAQEWQGLRDVDMNVDAGEKPCTPSDDVNWWQTAQIEEPASDLGLGEDHPGLRVDIVFGSTESESHPEHVPPPVVLEHRSQSLAPVPSGDLVDTDLSFGPLDSQLINGGRDDIDADGAAGVDGADPKQSPEELLDGMREHYLQALYISKTSLAYFAKGPLTRCRTAFQCSTPGGHRSATDLIEFYREAILAAKKMDLKYRETLPASVREAILALSDDENGMKMRKRKSKKKTLGKNGLYAEEDVFICKWWKERTMTESAVQETSREAETKKHISDLRLRETQLQILLILEVMALESTVTGEKTDPGNDKAGTGETEALKKPRIKKPQDLTVLLELHLDRLCIWHAVTMEESTVETDAMRDFCTEVIIPFYASRLRDKCKLISRKFGVSGGISPTTKKTQSSRKSHRTEPGSEVKRQPPEQRTRRSLHRVLTDEKASASQGRVPLLQRSITAPSGRPDSLEPMLPTVVRGSVRGGIPVQRVEKREVDLTAIARQHENKLRKVQALSEQKKELDAAITALRKPNREMVAKDIADDAAKRMTTGGGSSRKPKNPVRNPFGEGVQVMATPRGNRKKDVVIGLPPLPRSLAPSRSFSGETEDHSLAESPLMIPSSTRRAISFAGPDSTPFSSQRGSKKRAHEPQTQPVELGSIQETPTRPSSKLFPDSRSTDLAHRPSFSSSQGKGLFRVPTLPPSRPTTDPTSLPAGPTTPVSSRHKPIPALGPDSSSHLSRSFYDNLSSAIMETPPKQRDPNPSTVPRSVPSFTVNQPQAPSSPTAMETPVKIAAAVPMTPEQAQTRSIYEQLGWDDDEMEL
ncbi:hypothetical protein N7462_004261 [Penicillium macrosclerotiorum]|uniref:uncharacterized protein n=1 Tax=Penicillium macrosclerotiorum TaxID=303699 RepID=UPI00254701D6|nr:uncharacterized protein N7462_004261 [Penicillium macrosclerotiorum]KAJ5689869.1 hypothetical protein N7462_004261 [Penicillium macrosclerotiorum]